MFKAFENLQFLKIFLDFTVLETSKDASWTVDLKITLKLTKALLGALWSVLKLGLPYPTRMVHTSNILLRLM